ncbi:SpoIIE family protein phosphatase [Streptomyces sp. NPDC096311]|uniref:SpoIIE family protein phosphatase n=1 Tax=Streptomyces sp. NPDC096311 TaxID=3366083 RepID=UPI003824B593
MERSDTAGHEASLLNDRDLVGQALTARVVVDEHGTVTGWSEGAERLLGYSSAQILGRLVSTLLAEQPPAKDLPPLAHLPQWQGNLTLRHRDGHRLERRVVAHHRLSEHGDGGWLLVSALAGPPPQPGNEALVNWSFSQSPTCTVALYDASGRLRTANKAMQRALDLTEDSMRGLRVSEVMPNWAGALAEEDMKRVLETGEPFSREVYLRTLGETREHAWEVSHAPLRDSNGRIQGLSLTAHDVTEQHWARKRLQLIAEAGKRVGSTLDVTRTAQELADVTVPELADFMSVDLLASLDDAHEPSSDAWAVGEPLALRRIAHQSVYPDVPEAVVAPGEVDGYPEGSPPVESLRAGRAALYRMTDPGVAEWVARDPLRTARVREPSIHSVMTAPLSARGAPLGVAVFVRHRRSEPFHQDDLVLAEELAARAAVCIDNARRYTRQRDTAVTLQRSLLPQRLPEQAAVELASRYLPAGARAGVGGDWFDAIPLSGARVALVVGDVVGHGIHASATMGRLRTAVRTLADIDLPPDELLTHLDDLVGRLSNEGDGAGWGQAAEGTESAGDVGATCLYAVYDPISRRCSLARAGHPLPILVRPGGGVELLDVPAGPPLGLGGLPFEAVEVDLPEGSVLALYTDGLIESRERGMDIEVGISRLCETLSRPVPSLDALCDTVLGTMLPRRPTDDVALLIARTRALDASQVATWRVDPEPAAVAGIRREAVRQVEEWGLTDAVFTTELIVSELVTNAIRYADPPIQLRLIHDRSLICEVSDGSSTAPHMRRARTYDEGGRGLLLVAQLSDRWGTRQTSRGKTIWAQQCLRSQPVGGLGLVDPASFGVGLNSAGGL